MIPLAPIIASIPAIIKLFDKNERKQGVQELTGNVLAEASKMLGVEFKDDKDLISYLNSKPDEVIKLKQLEADTEVNLKKIEQQRYETAHNTYSKTKEMADKIATQIIKWNLPVIAVLVIINIVIIREFKDDGTLVAIVSNIIGITIGKLFTERQAVINFFFGSSIGSKEKDVHIANLNSKNEVK